MRSINVKGDNLHCDQWFWSWETEDYFQLIWKVSEETAKVSSLMPTAGATDHGRARFERQRWFSLRGDDEDVVLDSSNIVDINNLLDLRS